MPDKKQTRKSSKPGQKPDSGADAERALGLDTDSAGGYAVPKQTGGPPPKGKKPKPQGGKK